MKKRFDARIKLIMNSLYGVQIRRDISQSYKCKSHPWTETDYNDIMLQ